MADKLLAYAFECFQHLGFVDYVLLLAFKSLCGSFDSQTLYLKKHLDVLEGLDVLLGEKTVSLGVSLRVDVLREIIRPEADARSGLSQYFGSFADGV